MSPRVASGSQKQPRLTVRIPFERSRQLFMALADGANTVSPDGSCIVLSGGDSIGNLWLPLVAGGKASQLTKGAEMLDVFPNWSPDGKSIASMRLRRQEARAGSRDYAVYMIPSVNRTVLRRFPTRWRQLRLRAAALHPPQGDAPRWIVQHNTQPPVAAASGGAGRRRRSRRERGYTDCGQREKTQPTRAGQSRLTIAGVGTASLRASGLEEAPTRLRRQPQRQRDSAPVQV